MTSALPIARVALDVPISDLFDYLIPADLDEAIAPGHWVLVPWGAGRRVGIVAQRVVASSLPAERLKPLLSRIADAPSPDPHWLALGRFAADYYHRSLGEVLLPAIPKLLRTPPSPRSRVCAFARARQRTQPVCGTDAVIPPPTLNAAQQAALQALCEHRGFRCRVLHGITGSGKTEVYLHWIAELLRTPHAQVLMLVPEIGLTPQMLGQLQRRFPTAPIAILHSDLPDGERAAHWLAAADGRARLVVGTRLAVLAPFADLAAIIVDEEHDPSYKQQEGVRYSARDLAIALGSQRGVPVLLGSATPALETWHAGRVGRYQLLSLPQRAAGGALPALRIVGLKGRALRHGLSDQAIEAIHAALERGGQVLVFLNRRGFAPVLNCEQCGWISRCDTCSACRVLHRIGSRAGTGAVRYRMMCHHCGADRAVPRNCPTCGNVDLAPLGRGTQRIEQGLAELFPAARVARLDRDVARRRGAAESVLAAAHAGDVDILVGTQMLAKGHDFGRLTLVVVVDADGGLYSSDFRAPERLFATLMQVAGRAGRSAASGDASQVIVQTRFPEHPLFADLLDHDYARFANRVLEERDATDLPPFVHQALLRAESGVLQQALDWLAECRQSGERLLAGTEPRLPVRLFDPVPMAMVRVANTDRAQLLLESRSRKALHRFITDWLPTFAPAAAASYPRRSLPPRTSSSGSPVRWQLEIDPMEI
jgi:primosomal protein N' (replication factor Y)